MNLLYSLPSSLVNLIYEYDATYRDKYRAVVSEIKQTHWNTIYRKWLNSKYPPATRAFITQYIRDKLEITPEIVEQKIKKIVNMDIRRYLHHHPHQQYKFPFMNEYATYEDFLMDYKCFQYFSIIVSSSGSSSNGGGTNGNSAQSVWHTGNSNTRADVFYIITHIENIYQRQQQHEVDAELEHDIENLMVIRLDHDLLENDDIKKYIKRIVRKAVMIGFIYGDWDDDWNGDGNGYNIQYYSHDDEFVCLYITTAPALTATTTI